MVDGQQTSNTGRRKGWNLLTSSGRHRRDDVQFFLHNSFHTFIENDRESGGISLSLSLFPVLRMSFFRNDKWFVVQ
jgi:hypothetical protein